MLRLHIGNKNYSSWSMRAWVLLRQAGISFEEKYVRFDGFDAGSAFKRTMSAVSPTATVPLLQDGDVTIWDSLAIAEYVAEQFPEKRLWPEDRAARAAARSAVAEMHGGFTALRSACSMNIEADLADMGRIIWRDNAGVRKDMERITAMWIQLLARYGGPMLFGEFSVADAYYAPVCSRIRTYQLPVPGEIAAYIEHVHQLPGVQAWIADALAEQDFIPMDEPYRSQR
ncbi:glutathione S-transferase family protein [Castellaniella daejeonensis]|uniref:Glutathione S-transferase family protein n=1 Tax=Castellaniella daejeonensis TaxID=659013 RepID=A0ABN0TS35_9BURK